MMGFAAAPIFAAHGMAPVGVMLLFPTLLVGLTVLLALYAAKSTSAVSAHAARVDVAVEIVRGRYARGEIDANEYNRLVTGLTRTA